MVIDPIYGNVFLCENNGQNDFNRVIEVHPSSGAVVDIVAQSATWISGLQMFASSGSGHFPRLPTVRVAAQVE